MTSVLDNPSLRGMAGVLFVIALILGLRRVLLRLGRPGVSWHTYLRGQGSILFGFLCLGAAFGWLGVTLGSAPPDIRSGIKVIEYRPLHLAGHPLYEEIDVGGYTRIAVYARAAAPAAARVSVKILAQEKGSDKESATAFDGTDVSWTRLEKAVTAKHLTLIIGGAQTGYEGAEEAEVIVILSRS